MNQTLKSFHKALSSVWDKKPNKTVYENIVTLMPSMESRDVLEKLIAHCNLMLESGIVGNIQDGQVTLFDNISFNCNTHTNREIVVQIRHYGQWRSIKEPIEVLRNVNVLFNRKNNSFTMSDFSLMKLISTLAIKEHFYKEIPNSYPDHIIQRKLSDKNSKKTLIDYELYELRGQEELIVKVVDYLTILWLAQQKENGKDLNAMCVELAKSIKHAFLSILDREMLSILSVLPDSNNLSGFYQIYQSMVPYKEALLKWQSDSQQRLMFVLYNKEQGKPIDDPLYFAYPTLLDPSIHRTFLDKTSIRRVFQTNLSILNQLLACTPQNYNNYKNFFSLWTYWLGHTKLCDINPNVFKVLTTFELHTRFDKNSPQHIKKMAKHGVPLLDVLYTYLLEHFDLYQSHDIADETFVSSFVFNDTYEYFEDEKLPETLNIHRRKANRILNEISDYILFTDVIAAHQSNLPNLLRVNTKSNMNSLARNARIWHLEAQKREMGPLTIWKQFKPFSADIEGYKFKLITDNHQLFNEGVEMKHCVSRFETQIRSDMYIVLSMESDKERGTVGLAIAKNDEGDFSFRLHQIKGESNIQLSKKANDCAIELSKRINSTPELIYTLGQFPKVQEFVDPDQGIY